MKAPSMTVGELRIKLEGLPDDLEIVIEVYNSEGDIILQESLEDANLEERCDEIPSLYLTSTIDDNVLSKGTVTMTPERIEELLNSIDEVAGAIDELPRRDIAELVHALCARLRAESKAFPRIYGDRLYLVLRRGVSEADRIDSEIMLSKLLATDKAPLTVTWDDKPTEGSKP